LRQSARKRSEHVVEPARLLGAAQLPRLAGKRPPLAALAKTTATLLGKTNGGRAASLRIAIASRELLFRQGLSALLQDRRDVVARVVEIDDPGAIASVLAEDGCDILVIDVGSDRGNLATIEALTAQIPVIGLFSPAQAEEECCAILTGARAVLGRESSIDTLMAAVRAVSAGGVWMPPSLRSYLMTHVKRASDSPGDRLTPREREIVREVATGLRSAEVARKLHISEVTVKKHLNNIFHKLGVRDRVELTLYAVRTGLASTGNGRAEALPGAEPPVGYSSPAISRAP
jgi:DNA-binding NarL/FixJ family response regulator